jgi:hypothetical protein
MTGLFQWVAMLALGAFVAFLVARWQSFVGSEDLAFLIGFPALCIIALICDARRGRFQGSSKATTEPD